jgi:RNA polymerase sigma factor (sigma-70 family)
MTTRSTAYGKLKVLDSDAFKKLRGKHNFRGNYVFASPHGLVVYNPATDGSPRRMFSAAYSVRALDALLSEEGKIGEKILDARAKGKGKIHMTDRRISDKLIKGCLKSFSCFKGSTKSRFDSDAYHERVRAVMPVYLDPLRFPWTFEIDSLDKPAQKRVKLTKDEEEQAFLYRDRLWFDFKGFLTSYVSGDQVDENLINNRLSQINDANNELVVANLPLCLAMYKSGKFNTFPGIGYEEFLSEAHIKLINSVECFDVSRGFRFSTYACRGILQGLRRLAGKHITKNERNSPLYDDEGIEDIPIEYLQNMVIEEDLETLRGAMNAAGVLTPLEKSILVQRFGLGEGNENEKEKILKEIGVNHKLTTERVRQIQMMAQKKLRRVLEARV